MVSIVRLLPLLLLGVALWSPVRGDDPAAERRALRRTELRAALITGLEEQAAECEATGDAAGSRTLRDLLTGVTSDTLDIDLLPEQVQGVANPGTCRHDYADGMYELALEAIQDGHPSEAFHDLRETAFHNPDHETARKLLGYVLYEDRWVTPYTALMLRRGEVDHPVFGWLPAEHVARYEAGQRFYKGRWMPAAAEAEIRSKLTDAWEVESDHFLIRTTHSLERGVELSRALEILHRFFLRNFTDFFATPQQMKRLFDDGKPLGTSGGSKHEVVYLATREAYAKIVRNKQPGADQMNGLYMPGDRIAYLFANEADPEASLETMYHEVTHQILSESNLKTFEIATDADFWVIEGIACYMESFEPEGAIRVGDPGHSRLYFARERIVAEDWFQPLERFTQLGRHQFQFEAPGKTAEEKFRELQRYYSQATGLTHFLLHYDNGRYRDGFVQYLARIYSADARVRKQRLTLAEVLGVPFEDLDRLYVEYISRLRTGGTGQTPDGNELPSEPRS
jgi:hypothetical protein